MQRHVRCLLPIVLAAATLSAPAVGDTVETYVMTDHTVRVNFEPRYGAGSSSILCHADQLCSLTLERGSYRVHIASTRSIPFAYASARLMALAAGGFAIALGGFIVEGTGATRIRVFAM